MGHPQTTWSKFWYFLTHPPPLGVIFISDPYLLMCYLSEVTEAAVKEPATPESAPLTEFPLANPLINQ